MQGDNKLLLLTPLALRPAVLRETLTKSSIELRKFILRFALVQALFLTAFWAFLFVFSIVPAMNKIQEEALLVLKNANFTTVTIANDTLYVDIKPKIFTYSLENSKVRQRVIVVDDSGTFNKYYWDDRVDGGVVKEVNGIGFLKDKIFIKYNDTIRTFRYSTFFGKNAVLTKEQVQNKIIAVFGTQGARALFLITLPFVFLGSFVMGIAMHLAFSSIMGIAFSIIRRSFDNYFVPGLKLGAYLYIGYYYFKIVLYLSTLFIPYSTVIILLLKVTDFIVFLCLCSLGLHYLPINNKKVNVTTKNNPNVSKS